MFLHLVVVVDDDDDDEETKRMTIFAGSPFFGGFCGRSVLYI